MSPASASVAGAAGGARARLPHAARALVALLALLLALAAPATAAEPKASLPDIEDEVMCVSCNVALNVAESPQAYRQREYIRALVDQGLTKAQIKDKLVEQYGPNVLAMPEDDDGITLAAYLVPIAVVLALIVAAALLLPRWRRRTPAAATAATAPIGTDAELSRLDADLERFDRGT
jgi:cytochrome c-type biogenesis protein CcmH